ncbi:MAG: SGNH/GDSL hydrolase family protein [Xanthomonadales bacterium]|nr:SGNH/GDSL hydrolase family protein [Xanthomonadales bacterium]
MKYLLKLLSVLCTVSVLSGCVHSGQYNSSIQILFVGNSLTYYNDVPAMVGEIYSAMGDHHDVETDMLAQGGYSIEQHLSNDILKSTLANSEYDVVILQDFGGWPLCSTTIDACSSTSDPLSEAIDLVRLSGARPIWFSTYQETPDFQRELSREAHRIATSLDVEIADVGAAMLAFSSANDVTDIILPNHHPNTLGSWIAAATIARSLIGKPLPEVLVLDSICRQIWQGSRLSANQLASAQQSKKDECDRLAPGLLQKVVTAANKSLNTHASGAGAG